MVWYDYHIGIAGRNNGRETPGDVSNAAFLAGAQADVIPDAKLFGKNQMQAGEDVGQRFLQGEGDGHTTDAQGSQDGGNGNSVILKNDEESHRIDDAVDDGVQQGGLGHFLFRAFDLHVDDAIYRTGDDPRNRQDDDGEQNIGENFDQWFAEMAGVDNPIESDNETEGNRHAAERVDKDELPGSFLGREVAGNALVNDAVDGDTGCQGSGENAAGQNKHFQKMSPVNPGHPFHSGQNKTPLLYNSD